MAVAAVVHPTWRRLRRAVFLVHRWLGIAGCLLFLLWFVSGLVMLHVRFPTLTPQERLDGLPALGLQQVRVTPAQALERRGIAQPRKVVLEGAGDALVWRVIDANGQHHAVSATDMQLPIIDPVQAELIAQTFARAPARFAETLSDDQWTLPNANSFDKARPLHRITIEDAIGTELYVSAKTGEVVRDTTAFERRWTVFGTLLHYYTYAPIRRHGDFWRQLVLWTSGLAMVSAATGIVVGLWRVRLWRRYRGGSTTPYRGWMAWHHIIGLLGGITILTWVFSGWFSMGPNRWLSHSTPPLAATQFGGARKHFFHDVSILAQWANSSAIKTVEAAWFNGRPVWILQTAEQRMAVYADTGDRMSADAKNVWMSANRAYPGTASLPPQLLTGPDRYWYSRHVPPVLPVWRVMLHDDAATWLHVDAVTGQLLMTSTTASRWRRWLFNGLHSFDLPLFLKTPGWYALIWILSALGIGTSVTGIVIGWRRLKSS